MRSAAARQRLPALLRPAAPGRSSRSDEPFVEASHVLSEHRLDEVVASASEPHHETALLQRGERSQYLRSRNGPAFGVRRIQHGFVGDPFRDLLEVLVGSELRPVQRERSLELAEGLLDRDADRLRAILLECGVEVQDTPSGTAWSLAQA